GVHHLESALHWRPFRYQSKFLALSIALFEFQLGAFLILQDNQQQERRQQLNDAQNARRKSVSTEKKAKPKQSAKDKVKQQVFQLLIISSPRQLLSRRRSCTNLL